MKCPTEFTYSTYVDGELSAEEHRQVETHVTACDGCRILVEALRAETRMLVDAMQSVPAPAVSTASDWRVGLRMLLGFSSMIAVAAVFVTAATWLESLLPDAVEMNLFNKTAWMDLAFTAHCILQTKELILCLPSFFPRSVHFWPSPRSAELIFSPGARSRWPCLQAWSWLSPCRRLLPQLRCAEARALRCPAARPLMARCWPGARA